MDVRQFAFLVRQPSAALLSRERFWGMPKRGVAFLLANIMLWQPLWAQANGIVVSAPGTTLDHAGNGVPVVNIAAPNASGLSHNQFRDYNVGSEGVILNNATGRTQTTQLGGIILGNPNLHGTAASTILNEVNGGNPSQLRGYTEVAGQSARVIVANPYGISCNGCGFINTPRVTLSTGKPILNNGRLDHFQVDGGSVAVEGAGLNASNVDSFEIITRSAKINAEIQARNLTLIAGRNDVDAHNLNTTARANDGSAKPELAIDSSALGGMYAGVIKLVGTEAGVGVRLAGNLAASGGDIQIDANGHLSLAQAASSNAINVKAASLDAHGPVYAGTTLDVQTSGALSTQHSLAARDRISLSSGGPLRNSGIIEAGVNADNRRNTVGDVTLSAQNLRNAGSVTASRNLDVRASQALDNRGGTLNAQARTQVTASTLDNRQQGRVLSNDSLGLNAERVLNHQGLINSRGTLGAQLGYLDNSGGEFSSHAATYLNVAALDNVAGLVMAGQNLSLAASGAVNNRNGRLGANQAVSLSGTTLDNSQNGLISAASNLDLNLVHLDNQDGLVSAGSAHLNASSVENSGGRIASKADLVATVGSLTQQGGELVAQGNLSLTGTTLDNRKGGLVGAGKALTVQVDTVDNRGGELSSSAVLNLVGQQLNNSNGGKVLAGTDLGLTVAHVINQAQGLLHGQGRATVIGQTLENSGGTLSALSALDLRLDGALNNLSGLVSSEGALTVNAASLNNHQGNLSSAGPLSLTSSGAIDNQGGQLVTDAGLNLQSASLDNRQLGSLSGKGPVQINTGVLDNSHGGRLTSSDTLDLTATQVTNQDNGRIASDKALTASITGLDQQGGLLFSNSVLTLNLNHGQLNNQNGLITAPLLMLSNLNGVNNQGGEISSAQAFTLAASNLDNSNGKLLSNQALTLRIDQAMHNLKGLIAAASLDARAASLNNQGGTLTSRDSLDLTVAGLLDNQNQGLINATNRLNITSAALNNQNGGSLLGGAIGLDFGTAGGDLNNAGGLITTAGPLSINHLRDLNNQGGEISSSQRFSLSGRHLDNHSGKLISSQQLALHGAGVLNQNGLISGWEGLTVSANSLDNRNNGTLSSRRGDLTVDVAGTLLNSGAGALVSQKNLTVKTANLDNGNGGILSSAGHQTLTVDGLLNNTLGGQIDSATVLTIQATTLDNSSGAISAQQALEFTGTALDNSAGNLIGNAAVTLNLLGALTNTNGKLASAGPLKLSASQVNNQGGQLASQGLLTLLTGGLDNRNRGTVAANDLLSLTATGLVQNGVDGLIYSQHGDLNLRAASLANDQGTLQSQGALTLGVTTGDVDNQNGRILAQDGDLNLTAVNLDNRGGVLASLHATLTATLSGWLQNGFDLINHQGGITQAERLNLTALAGIDNQGGRIAAQSGDVTVNTIHFDNRDGGLYAGQRINVTGGNLDNRSGQIAGQQIDLSLAGALSNGQGIIESDSTLSITAASLDNQSGQLRALGTNGMTRLQIGGLLDNRDGNLESANTDLSLLMGGFLNAGGTVLHVGNGTFDIATANVINAGGNLITRGGLTLSADRWTNSSVIQAGRLNVNVNHFTQTGSGQLLAANSLIGNGVNWSNDGLIASDGSLDLRLTGLYSGNGRLSSLGDLTLYAGQLHLPESASIASGGNSLVTVGGLLNNYGRLTSTADLTLNAGTLNNYGTLGSAQDLTLTTSELLNEHGLIFSGRDMGLRVGSLTNRYASIYSLGDLNIDRDGYGGWATSIVNSSGSIQSDGSLSLAASTIHNIRALLTLSNGGIYTAKIEQIQCIEGVNAGDCSGKRNRVWEIVQRDKLEVTAASAASSITAGGNLNINGGDLLNSSSTIATSGNFTATLNNLTNTGVETSDTETVRVFRTQRSRGDSWSGPAKDFTERYWFESSGYDANNLGGLEQAMANFIGTTEAELPQFGRTTQLTMGDQTYAAIIQAAGNVNITTQNTFDNSVVRGDFEYVGSGPNTNTEAPGSEFSTRVTLNQQLPPDLAQQQVNPLALPGFELPTGQNGLFRLSGQGSSQGDTGPHSWNLGDASVGSAQRQQEVPGTQGRDIGTQAPGNLDMAGSVSVNKVQGLPSSSGPSNPHKYLIETNPVLTDLKQFMSSDYLLGNLGYDPDNSAKRLGDGFYEQYLIQQAVVARTGQRFLDGLTSDEDMFRYLMDNAIASKDALHLSLGVSLTAEQVAALTHDIVWMETVLVDGQEVMVPVLYLAQSNNRLAANGALIQGKDVTLIAGNNLSNAGKLKASHNLAAMASNNLLNSGLVQAGNRLDLLAGNDLSNKAGGIISGRDVSLTSLTGDVINERTVTGYDSSNGYNSQHRDFVDNAARIEAANDLTIQAGRDVSNIGGAVQSGRDTRISAGRDVTLGSATQVNSDSHGKNSRDLTISQNGSSLDAGRDLSISAGRDLTVTASRIDSSGDMALSAVHDVTLTAAANEEHSYSKRKKVTASEDHVRQQSTVLTAGGDVSISAGQDLTVLGSEVRGGGSVALDAERDVSILAAQDEEAYFYSKKTKGSFGKSKSKQREGYDSINVASVITAGKDLTINISQDSQGAISLNGGRDVNVMGSQLQAGNDLLVGAQRDVSIVSGIDEHGAASKKSKSGVGGFSKSGSSQLQTSTTQVGSELNAGNDVVIAVGNDINLRASAVHAGNDAELRAGLVQDTGDINLTASNDSTYSQSEKHRNKVGLSSGGSFVSIASVTKRGQGLQTSESVGSVVTAGRDATLRSARDVNIIGSGVVADRNVNVDAGRDVNVLAGQSTAASNSWESEKKAGLGWSGSKTGASVFIGADLGKEKNQQVSASNAASQISAGQDLNITAGRDLVQQGSGFAAERDISLKAGRDVISDAGQDHASEASYQQHQRAGLSAQASQSITSGWKDVGNIGSGGSTLSQVSSVMRGIDGATNMGGSASISAGVNQSTQKNGWQSSQARSSSLDAGRDLKVEAGRDITLSGTQGSAGRDIRLDAGRDLTIQSTQSQNSSKNHNSSGSASVGIGVGSANVWDGQQGGSGIYIAGSAAKGDQRAEGSHNLNSHLNAGGNLELVSGRDTTIAGAVVSGDRVAVDVGRNLTIKSRQDSDKVEGDRYGVGGSISIGGGGSANVSVGKTDGSSHWVNEQTHLEGRSEVDIHTGQHTQIDGAVVVADNGNLRLDTGTLGYSDIRDKDHYKSYDIALGGAFAGKDANGQPLGRNDEGQAPNATLDGQYSSHDREQINRATVGAGTIIVRDNPGQDLSGLNRDVAKAQEITKDQSQEEDLYLSSNSVGKVGDAAGAVAEFAPSIVEGVQRARAQKALTSDSPAERSAGAKKLFQVVVGEAGNSADGQRVSQALQQLAAKDPTAAQNFLNLLHQAGADGSGLQQNLTAKAGVSGLLATVAQVLVLSSAQQQAGQVSNGDLDPTTLANWTSGAGNPEQHFVALELIKLLLPGIAGSPIEQSGSGLLSNPGLDPNREHPGNGGFVAGGEGTGAIEGSRINDSSGWGTTSPALDPSLQPGNMHNEEKPVLVTNPKHIPGGDGFRPNAGIQPPDYVGTFEGAVKFGNAWWGVSSDGKSIYRYFEGRDGTVHWAGSTGDEKNPLKQKDVPSQVLKEFKFKAKGSKSPW